MGWGRTWLDDGAFISAEPGSRVRGSDAVLGQEGGTLHLAVRDAHCLRGMRTACRARCIPCTYMRGT